MTETTELALVPEWTLGWRLQRALAHAGITTNDIATELEVSRATISRWINDHGAPPRAIYVKEWALRCGVPYEWIQHGAPESDPDISAGERAFWDMCRSTWTCGPPELDAA